VLRTDSESDRPRTCNPLLKRQVLCPLELRTQRRRWGRSARPTPTRSASERPSNSASASNQVRPRGLEPRFEAWKATVVPLDHDRVFARSRFAQARGGSRTHAAGLRDRHSSPELHGRGYTVGIEPTALRFTGARSTQRSYAYHKSGWEDSNLRPLGSEPSALAAEPHPDRLQVWERPAAPVDPPISTSLRVVSRHCSIPASQWLDEESNSDLSGFNRALSPRLSYPTNWSGHPESNRVHECPRLACGRNTLPRRKTEVGMEGLEPSTPAL
jgi:hypothetical protein